MAGRYFSPSSSPWNTKLPTSTPIHASNAAYLTSLQNMVSANEWWINREAYSSPIYEVRGSRTPKVAVTLVDGTGTPITPTHNPNLAPGADAHGEFAWRLAQGVPIPAGATAATGTDEHMIIIDTETSELWEMWLMESDTRGITGWSCQWGGYMPNHRVNIGIFENPDWGATSTSLPLVAGMMLDAELRAGVIPHALQVLLPDPKDGYVWPAQRGDGTAGNVIPEGSRWRIKSSVDVTTYSQGNSQATATLRMIAKAMQDYGVVVCDRTASGGVVALRAQPVAIAYDFGGYANNILAALPLTDFEFISDDYRPPVVERVPSASPVETFGFIA